MSNSEKKERERIHFVTTQDILELMNKDDVELLQTLSRTSFGFERLLKNQEYLTRNGVINFELFEVLIEVSCRACSIYQSGMMGRILRFLRMLTGCDKFLFDDILKVINECLDKKQCINLASFVKNYLVILKMIMKLSLHSSSPLESLPRIVNYIFPALENILNTMKAVRVKNWEDVEIEYKKLKLQIEKYDVHQPTDDQDDDKLGLFRKLSIVPRENDIINVETQDLPVNKIDGPYNSINQYLSVHFRLMREDMIRSFRDFIKVFDNPNESHRSSCRIYEKVTVNFPPSYDLDGIVYKIDIKTDRDIDWLKKDVLLPGSMVCLTPDKFESVVFAIIKDLKASQGKSKESHAKLVIEDVCEVSLNTNLTYQMVETNAYFECYRHVLFALRSFDPNAFPLADFLVSLDFEQPEPEYLISKEPQYARIKTYTLKCSQSLKEKSDTIMCNEKETPKASVHVESESSKVVSLDNNENADTSSNSLENPTCKAITEAAKENQSKVDENDSDFSKTFNPLNFNEWPTAEELKLDDQQLLAFQTALTKKVAIIQGPPGTGKTFIGIKIVEALLENTLLKPIIICCLTNHALDQFLERILKFTKFVVRLGSQSKSELLEPHTLENLHLTLKKYQQDKNDREFKREGILKKSLQILKRFVPKLLDADPKGEYDEAFFNMREVCGKLNRCYKNLKLCRDSYLDKDALNRIIDSNYKDQLRQGSNTNSKELTTTVLEWLSCSRTSDLYVKCSRHFEKCKNLPNIRPENNTDIWKLDLNMRYKYFYLWREIALRILEGNVEEGKILYQQFKMSYSGKLLDSTKLDLLLESHVIGVTTTGAAKFRRYLESTGAKIIVIEEAAEVLESHVIASLLPTTQHLILIGDHKQLRPLPANHELSEVYNLKISMFERLFMNSSPSATLVSQHRMKPCIANLLVQDELYIDLKNYPNVFKYENIIGFKHSVFFLDHERPETGMSTGTSSSNEFEANMIVSLAKYLCLQGYTPDQLTILATYAAQVPLIKKHLDEGNLDVFLTTVDNYQGEENDIILVSFVRSNKSGVIGFLKESNRVCVALSRARKGMFCLGNFSLYSEKNPLWKNIVNKLELENMIGPKIPLMCSKHQTEMLVETSDDIIEFIMYGCTQMCHFQLHCGHLCTRSCHFDDPDHRRFRCIMPCDKYISDVKKCNRLCFERCKRTKKSTVDLPCGHRARYRKDGSIITVCDEEDQRLLPCNHTDTVLCSTSLSQYKCKKLVPVILSCGHKKNVFCYRSDNLNHVTCNDLTPRTGPCGHIIDVPCYLNLVGDDLLTYCKNACGELLTCGHPCTGYCRWCFDFGIHALCNERCALKLVCGHRCSGKCGSPCNPCKENCLLKCSHKECINRCDRSCIECKQPCERQCQHDQCTNKCDDVCSVEPCLEACNKILGCNHKCIGLCGDPCPYLCRVCNESDIKTGNVKSDRYIQLEDCDHVIEVYQLQEHINMCLECFTWPDCPVCQQPIRQSLRFKDHLLKAKQAVLNAVDNIEEVDDVLYLVNSTFESHDSVPSEFRNVHKKIDRILHDDKPSSSTLLVIRHCVGALNILMQIYEKLKKSLITDCSVQNHFDTLLLWISNHLIVASYQQLNELDSAIDKLKNNFQWPQNDT